jgi:hypothetical protein
MNTRKSIVIVGVAAGLAAALAAVGCGSASSTSASASPAPTTTVSSAATPGTAASSAAGTTQAPGALTGEAGSAAAGDIPDNQVFLTLRDKAGGFSMKYPEGWAQRSKAGVLTIQDKNNVVRVALSNAALPTTATVDQQMKDLRAKTPSLKAAAAATTTISGAPAIKVTYTTVSAPNAMTGKTTILMVDRYYLSHNGRLAVIDMGTPQGVDNVDAYRLMSESFTWAP